MYSRLGMLICAGAILLAGGCSENVPPTAPNSDSSAGAGHPALALGSGTWSQTGSMAAARRSHTATLLQSGLILVAGGSGLASAELYNPATGQWVPTGSMATSRESHIATLLPNGEVLVAGGIHLINSVPYPTATAELYNPSTGRWTATGSMATARSAQGATLLSDGRVLVAGGQNAGDLASAEIYDPSTGIWSAAAGMNHPRSFAQETLLEDGGVLVAGGYSNTAEIYAGGQWRLTSNMKYSHPGCRAALLTSGDVLAVGGSLASWSCEVFSQSAWTVTHNFGTRVPSGPLTTLAGGEVLLAGGETNYGTEALCALYDRPTNSWIRTGSLIQAREAHTATLLPNGQVLAVGGQVKLASGGFAALASAELYTP